jgi:hypothetical protein
MAPASARKVIAMIGENQPSDTDAAYFPQRFR